MSRAVNPDPATKIGLVGSGPGLARAIEAFHEVPDVLIQVVADVSGQSEGSRIARSLGIETVTNPMDVFRSAADVVLEVSGEGRQYERLLAVRPPHVEVMSARGARLLIKAFAQRNGGLRQADRQSVLVIAAPDQTQLYGYLAKGFEGIPGVQVVIDRRSRGRERRQTLRPVATDRRRLDRRRTRIDADLRDHGFAIVRAEAGPA